MMARSSASTRPSPAEKARRLAKRFERHYTPKHGSWLNMAEIQNCRPDQPMPGFTAQLALLCCCLARARGIPHAQLAHAVFMRECPRVL